MSGAILSVDVGTTGVKALVFDVETLEVLSRQYRTFGKSFPQPGWVEEDPLEILGKTVLAMRDAVAESGFGEGDFMGMGLANQRETCIAWDSLSSYALYPAIVWQDERTTTHCQELAEKYGDRVRELTGLSLDPYFSASKMKWLIDHTKSESILLGTVDSWILFNLTEGQPHFTDETNASRTLLLNIREKKWSEELLEIFSIPRNVLPQVQVSMSHFGELQREILGFGMPVLAVCGDQQASMYAAGVKHGNTKITYGTGTFLMQSIGEEFALEEGFFTTLVPGPGGSMYALEARIAESGEEITPLLGKGIELDRYVESLAEKVDLWLKRLPSLPTELTVDGAITQNKHLLETQARLSGMKIKEQPVFDGTALGVAMLVRNSAKRNPNRNRSL